MKSRPFLFNPLCDRKPSGGIAAGTGVVFRLRSRSDIYLSGLSLVVKREGKEETKNCAMLRHGGDTYDEYTVRMDFSESGLYFYYFIGYQDDHTFYICGDGELNAFATGIIQDSWQVTVFEREQVPEWFSGKTMYHIFADRFCRGDGGTEKPGTRLHKDWYDTPDYLPVNGKILNNDFFGGNFAGIAEKLDYLESLHVGILYLSPIFQAASNHRYDTGNYDSIDPLLGSTEDFTALCEEAGKRGIRVILDGVFNHTGDDSRYFNKYGRYPETGAFQSQDSPYRDWYRFTAYPTAYHSWWGIDTLPSVNQQSNSYREYIAGEDGIAAKWLHRGASGWRLDVVDELGDEFLDKLCASSRKAKSDAVIIGEVWEDASNKIAYGVRRRYFEGGQLNSVMNYPWKNAVIEFMKNGGAFQFVNAVNEISDHYPKHVLDMLMNILSTHDTARILTVLGDGEKRPMSKQEKAERKLSENDRAFGVKLLKAASLLQFTLPGVPCIYYGDEAGLEGYEDPFNRRGFPWGREDRALQEWYRMLGKLRAENAVFTDGALRFLQIEEHSVMYCRGDGEILVAVNRGQEVAEYPLWESYRDVATEKTVDRMIVYPNGCAVLKRCSKTDRT